MAHELKGSQEPNQAVNGNVVGGDKFDVGEIRSSHVAIGRNARVIIDHYAPIIIDVENFEDQPPAKGEAPYKGLAYFAEADKDIFVGREKISDAIVERLGKTHFLAIVGASGSGKSSLLRAGIIPRLRERNWHICIFSPGAHPMSTLSAIQPLEPIALTNIEKAEDSLTPENHELRSDVAKYIAQNSAERLLVAIDQFEEIFTQCEDRDERKAFVASLVHAVQAEAEMTLLISVRADYYGQVNEYAELSELVSEQQEYIRPMEQEDLVRVIAEPAKRGGWLFIKGLVEQFLADVGSEPGRLPLLSHALRETWERRSGIVMTLGGYHNAGGVEKAIAQTAEEFYANSSETDQCVAREILLRLAQVGEPGTLDSRRPALLSDLRSTIAPISIDTVLDRMVEKRLITLQHGDKIELSVKMANSNKGTIVEVAHEALIREWPRLREWLDEDREGLLQLERIRRDARNWDKLECSPDALYRGIQLAQVVAATASVNKMIQRNTLEDSFLKASQKAHKRRIRRQRLIWVVTSILGITLLFSLGVRLGRATQGQLLYQGNRVWSLAATRDNFFWGTGDVGVETYKITLPTGPDSGLQCAVESLAVDMSDEDHIYAAVIGQGIYHSTNAGLDWDPFNIVDEDTGVQILDSQEQTISCTDVGPLPTNVLTADGKVADLDVADDLLVAVVRHQRQEPTAFISHNRERAKAVNTLSCTDTTIPSGIAKTQIGQDQQTVYAGAHNGLFKGVLQSDENCWHWIHVHESSRVVALSGVENQLFWITEDGEIFYWTVDEVEVDITSLTTVNGRPITLAIRPEATVIYVLVTQFELLGALTSIQSVLAVSQEGNVRRVGWQPGFAYDLLAVSTSSEGTNDFWVLMAHENGVYLFIDETVVAE